MKTIATLPPLEPGQVWYYHPAWVYWERIGAADCVGALTGVLP